VADRTVASAAADLRLVDTKIPSDIAAAKRKLLAELRKIEAEAKIRVGVSFDAATANRDLARFRAALKDVNIQLGVDAKAAIAELETFNAQVSEADADDINVRVDVDGAVEATGQLQLFGALADEVDADDVNVRVDVDGAPAAIAQLSAVKAATADINRQERSGAGIAGAFAGVAGLVGPIALVGTLIGGLGAAISVFGVKASADIEQTIAAFENLLGSAEAATTLFGEIQDLADVSPFETQTLANATKSLLAIGVASEDVIPTVENLAGIVSLLGGASQENFGRLTLALGQIRSSMKPMTQDLYQIQNALPGFNAKLQLAGGIAEKFGISNQEALDKIEDGAITGEQAYDILIKRMEEFPGAASAIAAQAQTLQGQLSTFTDVVKRSLVESFLPITELIKEELPTITEATQDALDDIAPALSRSFETLIPTIAPLIETLGESLAPAFEGVFTALGSAIVGITPILEELGPLVGEIFPILGEIIETLGPAVADAAGALGGALVPALEAFSDVLNSIPLPVLTGLVEGILALTIASKVAGGVTALGQAMGILGKTATIGAGPIGLAAAALTGLFLVLGQRAEAEREIEEQTENVTAALIDNTAELLTNKDVMEGVTTTADAAAVAYRLLGEAIRGGAEGGDELATALNNIGIVPSNENIVRVLNQIGAFGDGDGNVANVPEIMDALTAAFGDQAGAIAGAIPKYSKLGDEFNQVFLGGEELTESQLALVRAIELVQAESDRTDLASITTGMLQTQAAADPAFESALKFAESMGTVDRFTTDAAAASDLFNRTLLAFEPPPDDVKNFFADVTELVEGVDTRIGDAQTAVTEFGLATEEAYKQAEQAIKDVITVLDVLLGRFDLDVAKQNLFENVRALPGEFQDVVTVARQQAKDQGVDFSEFLVSGDTEAARIAFQELVGPLVTDGINVVKQTLDQQGPTAAAGLAGSLRLQVIDALTRSGIDQTEAIELTEAYFPTEPWEAAAVAAAEAASAAAQAQLEEDAAEAELALALSFDTEEARLALTGLSNTDLSVAVNLGTDTARTEISQLGETGITVPVGADDEDARSAIAALSDIDVSVPIEADTDDARDDISELGNTGITVPVGTDTAAARSAISGLSNTDVSVLVTADVTPAAAAIRTLERILAGTLTPLFGQFADGGIVEFYRQGGLKESHVAQIAPAGAWRVWAEPETGGEAYIPMGAHKRERSEKILSTVADLFGMDLVPRPSAAAVARAAHGFGDDRGGGTAVLTREDVRTMARDIAEEVVAAMPTPVTVEHHPAGYSDPSAMAEIIYAKINRKVRRR
jgi:hypothetical protein